MSKGSENIPERPGFVPQIWAEEALEVIRQTLIYGVPNDNPTHIYVDEPLDPDFLAAREAFRERWDELIAEGEEAGFLEREHCFECPGEQYVPDNTDRRVAHPNPDYDPEKDRQRVRIPVMPSPEPSLSAASRALIAAQLNPEENR